MGNARLEGDSRAGLAEACRRIMDELASSTAETQAFAQASELVQQAVGILAGADHGRPYDGGEGSLAHYQEHMFIDHSPLVGPLNPLAPPIAISADGTKVTGVVTFGAAYEGPRGACTVASSLPPSTRCWAWRRACRGARA